MKIRVIQLINNFFKDQEEYKGDNDILGSYCAFGYFDALNIEEEISSDSGNPIWEAIDKLDVNTLDGKFTIKNLICIPEDEKKDVEFWENAKRKPYLFISLVRVKRLDDVAQNIDYIQRSFKYKEDVMIYCCYNHSELVVTKLEKSYSKGIDFVLDLREKLNALNMYSVFSVRQDILDSVVEMQNETVNELVDVRLRLTIKNDHALDFFLKKLWEELYKGEIHNGKKPCEENFTKFYTLGSSDIVVEIKQIEMQKILPFYGKRQLLTHTNEDYVKALYNVETEIL